MTMLMDVLQRAEAIAEELSVELVRVANSLEEMDHLRSRLPNGLGNTLPRVSLSVPGRLRTGADDVRKAEPTWAPTCGPLLTLLAIQGLITTAQAFLVAWCAANEAILTLSPWLLTAASVQLSAALTPVAWAVAGIMLP